MAASKVIPYYVHDNNVLPVQLQKLKNNQMLAVVDAQIGEVLVNSFNYVYDKGVMPDKTATADQTEEHVADNSSYIMVQKNRRAVEVPESELFTKSSAVKFIRSELIDANPLVDADSIIWIVGLKDLVLPNLAYDAATTKLLHKEAVNYISPTKGMIYTGQLIVSEGETVTAEIEQMLDSYKAEYELSLGYTEGSWKLLLGHTIFVLVILALIYVTVYFVDIDMSDDILEEFNYLIRMCTLLMDKDGGFKYIVFEGFDLGTGGEKVKVFTAENFAIEAGEKVSSGNCSSVSTLPMWRTRSV